MRHFKGYYLFILFTLLLTGCNGVEKDKSTTNTQLTIESYNMSEKERLLINKTDVSQIEFFKLNGFLKEEEDLQFSLEVYENGILKNELLKTNGEIQTNYKDSIISFGISTIGEGNYTLKLIAGLPSGLATTNFSNDMKSSSFSRLIDEKVTLEINKPMYLVAWLGTTKNSLRSINSENGNLPINLGEFELVYLYKVLWTDKNY